MLDVRLAKQAVKFLKGLPEDYRGAIKERLKQLEQNHFPHGALQLKGHESCFRIRVGPFRIQYYFMEKENVVLIYKISKRDETTYK